MTKDLIVINFQYEEMDGTIVNELMLLQDFTKWLEELPKNCDIQGCKVNGVYYKTFTDNIDLEEENIELKDKLDEINSKVDDLLSSLEDVRYYAEDIQDESNY